MQKEPVRLREIADPFGLFLPIRPGGLAFLSKKVSDNLNQC